MATFYGHGQTMGTADILLSHRHHHHSHRPCRRRGGLFGWILILIFYAKSI